ncbi:MAG: amidohydrolase family protein, partial [Rhodoferax sp.]
VKLWHDGSPYTGSMFTSVPYLDSPLAKALGIVPGSHGEAMIAPDVLRERIRSSNAAGWQVSIHTQGDASNRMVAEAIAKAAPLVGAAPAVRLEHAVMVPQDLLAQLAHQQVSVSFHINHILYYGDALAHSIIGKLAADQVLPVRRAFELGMRPTLHADSPMFPTHGFSLMQTAITRKTSAGLVLNAEQAIDVHQALRAMTQNGAYQLGIESQAGSLEPGKWADLQIVDQNPYSVAPEQLHQLRASAVYVAGKRKYASAAP